MSNRVLLVDDDSEVRAALGQTLELADLSPLLVASFVEAKDYITAGFDGVIVTDIRMPGRDGFHLLTYAREVDPDLPVILLTGEADVPMAVRAMSEGAFGFLEKPCAPSDFLGLVEKALRGRALVLENRRLKLQVEQGDAAARMLVGTSP
ncbi:MAG: response regulator, partial [Octadecabacter sp.]